MIESMVWMLAGMGSLFLTLALLRTFAHDDEGSLHVSLVGIVAAVLGFITWFSAGAAVVAVDVPYQFLYENAIDNSYKVVTGLQVTTAAAPLNNLFIGLGFVCLAWLVISVIAGLLSDVMGRRKEKHE